MLVDTMAYLWYMLRIYAVLIVLLFVIPLSMWKKYLAKKGLGERFLFCLITQTSFLVNAVLLLGILDICSGFTLALSIAAEYFLIRWLYSDRQFFKRRKEDIRLIVQVFRHQQTKQRLFSVWQGYLITWWRNTRDGLKTALTFLKEHAPEIIFLTVVCVYNIFFLTRNVFQYHCYQVSDSSVHLSWVYGLEYETLFIDGIYPFFMHSMIYAVWTLSTIPLREVILFLGAFMSVMLLLCIYLFAKRYFGWKYTSWLVMVLFSILLNEDRYGATLPQECGIFAMAGMAYYLVAYFRQDHPKHLVEGDSRLRSCFRINQYLSRKYLNYEFWMLSLCVSMAIGFHFYTAIAAVVMAIAIVMAYAKRFFRKPYLVPIVCAAITGAMITIAPYGLCLAKGIPFQASMDWAMSVIKGEEWKGTAEQQAAYAGLQEEEEEKDEEEIELIFSRNDSLKEMLLDYVEQLRIFSDTYVLGLAKIPDSLVTPYAGLCILFGFAIACIFYFFRRTRPLTSVYLAVVLNTVGIATLGSFLMMGLPTILDPSRASVFTKPFLFLLMALPFDAFFTAISGWQKRSFQRGLAVASLVCYGAAGVWMIENNYLHKYFTANVSYYNEPDFLIYRIQEKYPDFSYTIVSPTDEYYAVVEKGYHTELSEFMAMVDGTIEPYLLTTE